MAHVLNAWMRMPELGRQIKLPHMETMDFAERAIRRKKPAFLFVDNRPGGHVPSTI